MQLHILSDLHNELQFYKARRTDADVIVLAGDIGNRLEGLRWARDAYPYQVIVYVAGNHEFYNQHIQRTCVEMRAYAKELDIYYLDNDSVVIDGVRFLGSILWTDFELFGQGEMLGRSLSLARSGISDFNSIRFGSIGWMLPESTVLMHRAAKQFLEDHLMRAHQGPTVVVTHHAPSVKSALPKYQYHPLTPAFASNLENLIPMADLWIHGHMHNFSDYTVGDIQGKGRVICNPLGYGLFNGEVSGWDPDFIVDIKTAYSQS